jgi:putative alpha-1,2-mannosidase
LTVQQKITWTKISWQLAVSLTIVVLCSFAVRASAQATDPASTVNPLIGTTNGGNDYPGAAMPFGMVAWSPTLKESPAP